MSESDSTLASRSAWAASTERRTPPNTSSSQLASKPALYSSRVLPEPLWPLERLREPDSDASTDGASAAPATPRRARASSARRGRDSGSGAEA